MKIDSIHFLRPGDSETSKYVLNNICDRIVKSQNVSLCVAYFTHNDIANAIIERTAAKKPTRIVLNLCDILRPAGADASTIKTSKALVNIFNALSEMSFYEARNFEMRTLGLETSPNTQMHHKFGIFDNVVSFGSLNYTFQALGHNYENICFTSEEFIVARFQYEFDSLWKLGAEFYVQGGEVRSIACPKCLKSEGVDFESWGALCINCFHRFEGA